MGWRIVWAALRILGALGLIGMVAMLVVAGGIFMHFVHFKVLHWALGMAIDIAVGAIVGVALAAAGAGFQRLVSRTA